MSLCAKLAVGALAAHDLFDYLDPHLIDNSGVPAWWSIFCLACDATAAAVVAWLLN